MLAFDVSKVRTLLYYLGQSNKRLEERERSREKVRMAINRLKTISPETFEKDIHQLEATVSEALENEKKILSRQMQEEREHNELLMKIDKLQEKLSRYLDTRENREKRLKKLEEKIFSVTQPKKYEVVKLKEGLEMLEKQYKEERKSGEHSAQDMKDIAKHIKLLKDKIKELEESYL
ncbi:hypothetical protein GF342_00125 [Candidatus Woesearchaeota archaeon]|nr:hypothetical protein [Candidatus Woesearchaeota archaeon]